MSKDNFAVSKIVAAQHCPSFANSKIIEQQQLDDAEEIDTELHSMTIATE
jgi:hypothetical protein